LLELSSRVAGLRAAASSDGADAGDSGADACDVTAPGHRSMPLSDSALVAAIRNIII
jgi:hypothetical protein